MKIKSIDRPRTRDHHYFFERSRTRTRAVKNLKNRAEQKNENSDQEETRELTENLLLPYAIRAPPPPTFVAAQDRSGRLNTFFFFFFFFLRSLSPLIQTSKTRPPFLAHRQAQITSLPLSL